MAMAVAAALIALAAALAVVRMWRGPSPADRVLGLDLAGGCALAAIVLLAIATSQPVYLDVAFVLAVIGFLGTAAFGRWMGRTGGGDT